MQAREQRGAGGPVRLAVIGAGWVGAKHARLAHADDACALIAVCDPAPAAAAVAAELGVAHHVDYRALIEAGGLDGVIIATPTSRHAEISIACAARGLDLLVEKPITASVDEARRLIAAAERHGVALAVGHHRRFSATVEAARDIVRGGEIGRLVAFHAFWMLLKEPAYFATAWRSEVSAGPVMTNLSHDIDCLRTICGEVASVRAVVGNAARGGPVEDTAALVLTLEGGAVGTIIASDATPAPWSYEATTGENRDFFQTGENCYYFFGSEGTLAFPHLEVWRYGRADAIGWRQPIARRSVPVATADPLAAQIAHFARVVAGQEAPRVGGHDAARTLATTLAVLTAGDSGLAVRPEAVGSEAVGSEAVGSEAVGSEAVGSEAVGSEAVGSEAVRPEGVPPGTQGATTRGGNQ